MLVFAIVAPVLLGILMVFVAIKQFKNRQIEAERQAFARSQVYVIDQYCCNIKMRVINNDCQYSGGGVKKYYICYTCQKQIDFVPETYENPNESQEHNERIEKLMRKAEIESFQTIRNRMGNRWR